MMGTIVIGLIFACIVGVAVKKTHSDMKNNKCSCGSSCSDKSKCHIGRMK